MKIQLGLPDDGGCGFYRVRYPGDAVAEAEPSVLVSYAKEAKNVTVTVDEVGAPPRIVDLPHPGVDVVVMARPLRRLNMEMIEPFQRHGVAVVVDVDDDFSCIDPAHLGWHWFQPHTSPESNRVWLQKACQLADLVTTTTPALAQRYGIGHGRVQVLPNCVPRSMVGIVNERDDRTIGWAAHTETHPNDLQQTRGGVVEAMRATGSRFANIGTGSRVRTILGLDDQDEFAAWGPAEFSEYPYQLARFTVGIAPLADTPFNEAKSGLKGLEMAAVGVPFVASPAADYRRLAAEGIGILAASRTRSWSRRIQEMLGPEGIERAAQARQVVLDAHTYEGNAWRWAEAWERAIRNRHERSATAVAA